MAQTVIFQAPAYSALPGGTATLLQLRTVAQQEADMENDPHVSTNEWNSYINFSRFELYDMLIKYGGEDYYIASATIPVVSGTDLYPLPNGTLYNNAPAFYKGELVECLTGPGVAPNQPITMRRFNLREKNYYNIPQALMAVPYTLPRYRLFGPNLLLAPMPASTLTVRMWYAPRLSPMVVDADTTDDLSGWLEYVVVDAAIKAMGKQERDPSLLLKRKADLKARIEAMAANRDQGEANTVSETNVDGRFGHLGGPGYPGSGPWY